MRRKGLRLNQTALAAALGVTFQMVQRYEYGLCRITASTLYRIAAALDCPIDYFFDGLPLPSKTVDTAQMETVPAQIVSTHHGRLLAALFPRIKRRGVRRVIVELVRAIVEEDAALEA